MNFFLIKRNSFLLKKNVSEAQIGKFKVYLKNKITIHEFLSLIPFNMIHQFDISNLIIVHFFIPYINSQ